MLKEALDQLTPEQKKLLAQLPSDPTSEQYKLYEEAGEATNITPDKIAARIAKLDPAKAPQARRLAGEIEAARQRANSISTDRDVANYDYWETRCDLEQSPEALEARELAHAAHHAFTEADPAGAMKLYERSLDQWAKALAKFPKLTPDSTMGGDIMDFIDGYNSVLQVLDLSLAEDDIAKRFPLWEWLEANDQERKYAAAVDRQREREGRKPLDAPAATPSGGAKPLIDPAEAQLSPTAPEAALWAKNHYGVSRVTVIASTQPAA